MFNEENHPSSKIARLYSIDINTKPIKLLYSLFDILSPVSTSFALNKGELFEFNNHSHEANIMLLTEGTGVLFDIDNRVTISTIHAPSIYGLTDRDDCFDSVSASGWHAFYAETCCSGYSVRHKDFVRVIEEKKRWHDITRIMAHHLMIISLRRNELVGANSLMQVKKIVMELSSYPEIYRKEIDVLNFVESRSNLSRSKIMPVLSELCSVGLIVMRDGHLMLKSCDG